MGKRSTLAVVLTAAIVGGATGSEGSSAANALESLPSLAEDYAYPGAAAVLVERGINVFKGDGHMMLADCGPNPNLPPADLILVQTFDLSLPGGPDFCFKASTTPAWLTMQIGSAYVIRGEDTRTVNATVHVAEQPPVTEVEQVDPGEWQPVGVGQSRGDATVLQLRTGQGMAQVSGADTAVGKLDATDRACTGTLVDPLWILTAASCFTGDPDLRVANGPPARPAQIAFPGKAAVAVTRLVGRSDRDLVLGRLATPITDIIPAAVTSVSPTPGAVLHTVGFGRTATQWAGDDQRNATVDVTSLTAADLAVTTTSGLICKGDAGAPVRNSSGAITALLSRGGQSGCLDTTTGNPEANAVRLDNITRWIERLTDGQVADSAGNGLQSGLAWADVNDDGRADYCRRTGIQNGVSSFAACVLSTGVGFGGAITSGVIDWGYGAGRAWVDVNDDGRADYCRVGGVQNNVNSSVACTLSTGVGLGATIRSGVLDWGEETGRAWVDVNDDGRADYCRRIGTQNNVSSRVSCTLSSGTGFGVTITSGVIDWGYDDGRAWADANADGRADYCRRTGNQNNVSSHVACTLSTGTGFGVTITSGVLDWGQETGRAWVDANADGRADYCRRTGEQNTVSSRVACTLSTGTGFGSTITSGVIDWGYGAGRAWVDVNDDGRADYCRVGGAQNNVNSNVACTLSTGVGFGGTIWSGVLDWGQESGRAWADANADGRADYCRRTGEQNTVSSRVACTLSTGTGFGITITSGVIDWGYPN